MRARAGLILAVALLVLGCGPGRPELRARWYEEGPELYLALLNQGPWRLQLERVDVNASRWTPEAGFRLTLTDERMEPGQIRVFRLKEFARPDRGSSMGPTPSTDDPWACRVPAVVVVFARRAGGESCAMPVEVEAPLPDKMLARWHSPCPRTS